ncbi:hypothetical protein PM082_013249 [Marasmius tenuissimus]|nr:hypothetical protein PM082_013249 [Marasmius tenuissimus]
MKSRWAPFCIYLSDDDEDATVVMFILKLTDHERIWAFLKVVSSGTMKGDSEGASLNMCERMRATAEACVPKNLAQSPGFTEALNSLPGLSRTTGDAGILRVLVSFSEELDASHLDSDSFVAILNTHTICQSTQKYDSGAISKSIIMNATGSGGPQSKKRKRQTASSTTPSDCQPSEAPDLHPNQNLFR